MKRMSKRHRRRPVRDLGRLLVEQLEDRLPPGDLLNLLGNAAFLAVADSVPMRPETESVPAARMSSAGNLPLAPAGPFTFPGPAAGKPSTDQAAAAFEASRSEVGDVKAKDEWHVLPKDHAIAADLLTLLAGINAAASRGGAGESSSRAAPGAVGSRDHIGRGSQLPDQAALEAMARGAGLPAPPALPPPPGPSGPESGLNITLVADTNRDGTVTDGDLPGRAEFTPSSGAIYAVNFDDDNSGGSPDAVSFNDSGQPISEDFDIDNAADAQDLAPLVIKALGPGLTPDLRVFLTAGSLEDAQSIHVFPSLAPGTQAVLGALGNRVGALPAATSVDITNFVSATQDVTFGVEGMFFRNTNLTPASLTFDGQIDLRLQVFQGSTLVGEDAVRMKVAPWLMLPHTQESLQVWAQNAGSVNASYLFTSDAESGYYGLDASGQLFTVSGSTAGTQWFQDHVEIGYTQRPGAPPTQMVFRLPYFRGAGIAQPAWPQTRLLGPNVGTFQIGINLGAGAGDYGGNVEVLPPTPASPRGRIILGSSGSSALFNFFQSQETQPGIRLPTNWLAVSHVDEIIGFTNTPHEVIVADPQEAYDRLEAIPEPDRGKAVFFATGKFPEDGTAIASSTNTRIFTGLDHRGQTWQYLRVYDSSASGSGAAGQVARIAPGGLGNGFIDVNLVWNTTSKIVDPAGTSAPSAMRWALTANAPNQNRWFVNPQLGDRFVLVEGTRFWFGGVPADGTPAIVTTAEVLADNELRNLNLIDVQNTINGVRTTLDNAAGGPGTLMFEKVPVLYLGRRSGFATNRQGVAFTAGLQNFQLVGDEYYIPSQFGPRVSSGSRSGSISFTTNDGDENPFTFTVNGAVNAGPLTVTSLTPTSTGFTAEFNRPIDRTTLNLYDVQTGGPGAADLTLVGMNTGAVTGSLAVEPSGTRATFVRTGGVLPADSYTLTLRSAAIGFKDTSGGLLDGNGDGMTGDNYNYNFAISPANPVTVSVSDVARGPGQAVNVPATAAGLPLRLSEGAGVTSVQLALRYNPSLLRIIGATVGSGLPAGATVTLSTNTPGIAVLSFRSSTPLSAGASNFVSLTATVPTTAAYGAQHVLDITNLSINNQAIAARDDDGIHVAAYLGDTTGNGGYNSTDAQRALRVVVGLDGGFLPYPLTDPTVVADINGNGTLTSTDATRILQEAVGIDQAEIAVVPPISPPPPPAPDIQVLDSSLNIPLNSVVDFGNAPLGETIATRTFTVRNTGTSALTLGPITVPYGFVLVSGFGATTLAPSQQTTFTVRMMADGIDILESAANDLLPGARFVDCWNLYHRLLGEVHCGSVVMRVPYAAGWWSVV